MSPSSISNSNTPSPFPRLTKPALFALAILFASRFLLLVPQFESTTQADSRPLRNLFMADLTCELRERDQPEILLLGTSRTVLIPPEAMERRLKLPPGSVLNLSRGGAKFFFLETILKRNPDVLKGVKVLLIDVLPFQALYGVKRGEFFLRYASLKQRLDARLVRAKAVGVADFLLPVRSHPQDPIQWRTGIQQLREAPRDRYDRLRAVPISNFKGFTKGAKRLTEARRQGTGGIAIANLFFSGSNFVPNELNSLHNIIDMVPDDCRDILVWLPFRDDSRNIVQQSDNKSLSQQKFRVFLESIDDPKVELHWFEEASEINVEQGEYKPDGAHFTRRALRKVARTFAALARPHLKEAIGDRASPKS